MSYTNKELNVNSDLTFRQNLSRPMTAKELDTNFLKLGNTFSDVTNWINEIGQHLDANIESIQNSIKSLNDTITGETTDLKNEIKGIDDAHTKTESDINKQIADILTRLAEVEKKLGGSKTDS